uniref:Uncharacterized protein n=1 Tax=Plectus sambesii TaxID=2011161 RepID=A0A914VUN0_9BILA
MKRNRISGRLPFAHSASRYLCCCLCCACHVRTGALIIGVVDALGVGGNLYRLGEMYFSAIHYPSLVGKLIFFTVLALFMWNILAILTLFAAVCMGRPRLLLPKLGLQLVTLGFLLGLGAACIVYLCSEADRTNSALISIYESVSGGVHKMTEEERAELDDILRMTIISLLVVVTVSIMIEIWFFWVMLSCYKYLRDKDHHFRATTGELQPMAALDMDATTDDCCFNRQSLQPPPPYAANIARAQMINESLNWL